jgi:thiol-disulfide isomerase/thioredoxin
MNAKLTTALLAAMVSVVAFGNSEVKPGPVLTIGDPAPSIKTATWLKGGKLGSFKKGKIYVVEFWATWCGPCKENIPHLTELASKYKDKVSIIGVSIWESLESDDPNPLKKVKDFVDSQGEKMDYHVAADDKTDTIANSWMKPANEGGIPCSFIINGEGIIAWIGHPAKMEEALTKVIDGTFDIKAAREAREVELKFTRPIDEALAKKDYPTLLKTIDEAIAERPAMEYNLTYNRFVALFHVDVEQAKKFTTKVLDESNKAPGAYHMISSISASYDDLPADAYRFGLTIAKQGIEISPENIMLNGIEAEIYFHLNEKDNAIKAIKVAIEKAKNETRTSKEFREMLDKSLKKYEAMQG